MCGLVALRSKRSRDASDIARALEALRHRGPDGTGIYRSQDGEVWLGHTRLAVIAKGAGAQPVRSEDGSVVVIVNGELYGFRQLRRDLEARGHRFATESDSEVLVHLYEEHGLACVEKLRGEFAFVLWDAVKRRLVAGRDRFGVKPLVYAEQDGALLLASEAKALFALGVCAAWDQTSLEHALTHQYLPADRSLFYGVKQLGPGYLLIADEGKSLRLERYWDLDLPLKETPIAEGEAILRLRSALSEAVRLRLDAEVPLAFHLSGGIDSASVLALAAQHTTRPLHAFTVAFSDPAYGEAAQAQEIAETLGATHHIVEASPGQLIDAMSDAVFHGEGLCINGQLPAKLLLSRAIAQQGFKVTLSGEGADEALLGYTHLAHDLVASSNSGLSDVERGRLAQWDQAQAGIMLPQGDVPILSELREALGFEPAFMRAKAAFGAGLLALLRDGLSAEEVRARAFTRLLGSLAIEDQLRGRAPVRQSVYLWTRLCLAGYILRTLGDATEMAFSVEGRTPFLDHVFFECARELPIALNMQGGVQKHILREAVSELLPKAVCGRRKHPFLAPPLGRMGSPKPRAFILDMLSGTALRSLPLLDAGKVRAFAERSLAGEQQSEVADPILMTLVSACLVQERFSMTEGRHD